MNNLLANKRKNVQRKFSGNKNAVTCSYNCKISELEKKPGASLNLKIATACIKIEFISSCLIYICIYICVYCVWDMSGKSLHNVNLNLKFSLLVEYTN